MVDHEQQQVVEAPAPTCECRASSIIEEAAKPKVLLTMFGVINRSIRYTWPNIKTYIVDPLIRLGFDVEIYGFWNDVGNIKVDSETLNASDVQLVPFNYLERENQTFIDDYIAQNITKWKIAGCSCEYRGDYEPHTVKNAWRQLYSENRAASFIMKNPTKYSFVIASGPDFFYWSEFLLDDIKHILANPDTVMMSSSNNGIDGYTNGFYVGQPIAVAKVLGRFEKYQDYCKKLDYRDYEWMVRLSVEENNLFLVVYSFAARLHVFTSVEVKGLR
jgi:hypothetical protein